MKIVIVQGPHLPVPPVLGGAVEKMWYMLTKEFVKSGHEVTYLSRTYNDFPSEEIQNGIIFKRSSGFRPTSNFIINNFQDFLYSREIIKKVPSDADAIVTNSFWAPLLLKKSLKKLAVMDVARMPKGQMKLYKSVGVLRANSKAVAKAIEMELSTSFHKKIITIPNPLPFDEFKIPSQQKEKIFLFVGRIHPEKGIDLLIKSFNKLPADNGWKLQIIGPSDLEKGGGGELYLRKLKELDERGNVEFIPPIFDIEKLNSYYSRASVFVYPSLAEKGETFGLSVLEAMAWGCVPIVSSLDCFKDFVNESNGCFFDHRLDAEDNLLKALKKIIDDESIIESKAINAVEVRKTHSVSKIANDFVQVFKKLRNENS
jgi:glycosyltransferase involved in cell wall biosynthesis